MSDNVQTLPPPKDVNPGLVSSLETIARLAGLRDNWDGYGSPPLQPVAVRGAIHVLLASDVVNPPAPYIGPVTGGGLQIEWHTPTRELEVEILPDGTIEFVTVDEQRHMDEGVLPSYSDNDVQDLVRWLMHKQ